MNENEKTTDTPAVCAACADGANAKTKHACALGTLAANAGIGVGYDVNDTDCLEDMIQDVQHRTGADGGWKILTQKAQWSVLITKEMGGEPARFQGVKIFSKGLGHPVRGIVLRPGTDREHVCYYRTEEQDKAFHLELYAQTRAKLRADWEAQKDAYEAELRALPEVYQRRIDAFVARHADAGGRDGSWWEHEAYEIGVCTAANEIAKAVRTEVGLKWFAEMKHAQRIEVVPTIDWNEITPHAFGFALRIAHMAVREEWEQIERFHGATCPNRGCPVIRCWTWAEEQAKKAG